MNILTAVDFFDSSEAIINVTSKLAKAMNATVRLIHVAEPDPDFVGFDVGPQEVRDQIAIEYHNEHKALQELADKLRSHGVNAKAILLQGAIVDTILEDAASHDTDLIVVGSHGHGAVYDILVGSVSEGIIKKAKCPVTVVPINQDK
jgi:nucleotide-binding universal stress UspA family protein